jgi:acylphosphatase
MVALCGRGPPSSRVEAVEDLPGHSDALNLRRAGEAFSLLPTI